jgi:hypothetical protein
MNLSKPKFYFLKPIVVQGYIARVLALFYIIMRRRKYLINISDSSLKQPAYFNTIIGAFKRAAYF